MHLKKFLLFGLLAAVLPAVAEEAADRKTATSLNYVEHELDTRQNKFTAEANKAMEYTNAAGVVQKRAVTSDLDNSGTDSLPMVGGVNTKLDTKQDDIAAVNDHTAVTYTGESGGIGQKGIYQTTGTYVEQSDNLIDAKTFNAALKKGLDREFKCKEFKPGTDLCWVYSIHNPTEEHTKNLFNKNNIGFNDWASYGGATYTTQAPNAGKLANGSPIPIIGGETYILSYNGSTNCNITEKFNLYVYDANGRIISAHTTSANNDHIWLGRPWTFQDNAAYINISSFGSFSQNQLIQLANGLQLEQGDVITEYEPYENVYIPQNQ